MKKLFEEYVSSEAEANDEPQLPPPSRRNLPFNSNSDDLYALATAFDLYFLTGDKNKRQLRVG